MLAKSIRGRELGLHNQMRRKSWGMLACLLACLRVSIIIKVSREKGSFSLSHRGRAEVGLRLCG